MLLDKLIAQSLEFDRDKADYITVPSKLVFNEAGQIIAPLDMLKGLTSFPLKLTENALRQLCNKLGPTVFGRGSGKGLPFDHFNALLTAYPDLLGADFNYLASHYTGNSRWMVREYNKTCRAVVDGGYPGGHDAAGEFENTQYLRVIDSIFAKADAATHPDLRVANSNVTADDLNLRVIWKDVADPRHGGSYGIGFGVINGEIGNRKLKALPLVKVRACDNSIVADVGGFEFIHRGSLAAMRTQFIAVAGNMLKAAGELLDKFIEAEEEKLEDFDHVIAGICDRYGFSESIRDSVMAGTEAKETRAAVVNGLTWAAHKAVEDPNDQIEMETLGGFMLYQPAKYFVSVANEHRRKVAGLD